MATKNWTKATLPYTSIRTASFAWTVSSGGSGEYYLRTAALNNPSVDKPNAIIENGTLISEGSALGSLAVSTWGYGDADGLGYSTIYIRLSDGTDPDGKAVDYVERSTNTILLQGGDGNEVEVLSIIITNLHETIAAEVEARIYNSTGTFLANILNKRTIAAEGQLVLDRASLFALNNQDIIKIESNLEEVNILASGMEG
ncbi:MAG: hypothetical protein GQ540_03705 [Lutibacter sp.]|uniref:hypothetical protein n=1 Tax=Lutibacter sp. TaxID=1925666 RepID=UPI0019F506C3|nr:hypothetical protein [Lutibacter sp.]NOR27618.1 hypothetical protein [Lutibacter sp.]